MLALLLAPAWAETWRLQLPADQRLADWEEALKLTDLVAVPPGTDCDARLHCAGSSCDSWKR